jgi:recombination protein RecR
MLSRGAFAQLVEALCQLPGVGPKTAQRYAFFLLKQPPPVSARLVDAITAVRERLRFCPLCHNLAEQPIDDRDGKKNGQALCAICQNPRRDRSRIMVVEEPSTIHVIEKTGEYSGVYHVLMGVLSPLDGITPAQIKAGELIDRVKQGGVQEVIIATNPTMEGEATALYLLKQIKPLGVSVSRIAYGVPVGVDLEFADEATMAKALQGRRDL